MRSELRALRERIRQVEAGGHRATSLRREYNHKLRALKGGCGAAAQISGGGPPGAQTKSEVIYVSLQTLIKKEKRISLVQPLLKKEKVLSTNRLRFSDFNFECRSTPAGLHQKQLAL